MASWFYIGIRRCIPTAHNHIQGDMHIYSVYMCTAYMGADTNRCIFTASYAGDRRLSNMHLSGCTDDWPVVQSSCIRPDNVS